MRRISIKIRRSKIIMRQLRKVASGTSCGKRALKRGKRKKRRRRRKSRGKEDQTRRSQMKTTLSTS